MFVSLKWIIFLLNLFKGHFHHCVPVEVKAGERLSVFQDLHWGTFLWLGFLCGGEELRRKKKHLKYLKIS